MPTSIVRVLEHSVTGDAPPCNCYDATLQEHRKTAAKKAGQHPSRAASPRHALKKVSTALDLTMADLVLESSPREQIFEHTRAFSPAQLQHALNFVSGYLPEGELAAPLKGK